MLRPGQRELVEEHARERVVVVLAGVDQHLHRPPRAAACETAAALTNWGRLPTTVRTRTARACHVPSLRSRPMRLSSPAEPATSVRSSHASCWTGATRSRCSTPCIADIASAIPGEAAFEQVDLLDAEATRRVLSQGFDAVLHFAALALVGESVASPERYYHGNVVASLHLLDAMREAGVKRLVFSSTCATYGEPERVPIAEDEPPSPVNAYGNSS